ncbi:MAG: DUF4372 domain-containing protein [Bacteroidia bacterium]|nr:DUF4372 domain-containing protein [Bacteroidia bacterium]
MEKVTLFSQIILELNRSKFNQLVKQHNSNNHQKGFDSWTHLVSMLFCQIFQKNIILLRLFIKPIK